MSSNPPASKTITMQNMSYSVVNLSVAAGTSITWSNTDTTKHTVTADDNSFNSGDIAPGQSFTRIFSNTGSFSYHCIYHAMMKASINVN
jgi:plastocyanin